MNAIAPQPETAIQVPLEDLLDSPYQRERVSKRGNLDELAASMREVGVLEPAIARPAPEQPGKYQLAAGHRRKRAAKLAELAHLPVIVREYSDDQMLEVHAVENGQRSDVHPLDEADLYAELLKRGRTVAAIADKVGRSAAYVAQRMQLQRLTKECRAALDEDKLTLGAALELARVPAAIQDEALKSTLEWHDPRGAWGGPEEADRGHAAATRAGVRKLLEERFMLRLATAPFPVDDAELVKKAGACTACPKRTGNQAELFADVDDKDLCTDPACFKAKGKAYWPIRAKQAAEAGQKVLDGDEAKKALSGYGSGYKRLDDEVYEHHTGKRREVRKLAKKAELPVAIVQDPKTGAAVEVVREADVDKALRAARAAAPKPQQSGHDSYREQQRREEAKERRRKRLLELALGAAVAAAEASKDRDALEAIIVRGFVLRSELEDAKQVTTRRSIETPAKKYGGPDHRKALLSQLESMKPAEVRALGIELALHRFAPARYNPADPAWKTTLKALGVKLDKLEAQVATEEKARAKAKRDKAKKKDAKGAKAKASKAPKAKRGTCTECGCTDSTPCSTDHGPCCWVDTTETLCSGCAP